MEKQIINIFFIAVEEVVCERSSPVRQASLFEKWKKRRQERVQRENGLPVYENLRHFPYPRGEIRLCYCVLPRTFLKEAEKPKKMAKWSLCMEETVKIAEEKLQDGRFSYFFADSEVASLFSFADRIPPELFEVCLWDAKRQMKDAKISISMPDDCSNLIAEQMITILNPYLSRLNEVVFVGEESSISNLLEEYLYEEYGIVMIYQKYPLKGTVWMDLGEKVSPVILKYAKENGICRINEDSVRKFLDTAVKNGYNNKVN